VTSADFLVGLVVGLAVAGVTYVALRSYFRLAVFRRSERPSSTVPPLLPDLSDAPPAAPPASPVEAETTARPLEATGLALLSPSLESGPAPSIAERDLLSAPSEAAALRLSQRVLIHLARHGGLSAGGEPVTQRGILTALQVSQGALSSVLRRLEDGGAIASEKAHVRGRDRRVKVYALTPRGRTLVATTAPATDRTAPATPAPSATPAYHPSS
jgi:DNA-binding MarR family transcriptional regulator